MHFDKNQGGKESSFLVMMYGEKELDEAVKEIYFLCTLVIKGLMSIVKEETIISEEVLGILEDLKELNTYEIPNGVPPMRDKHMKVKVFNVGDDVMVFLCKDMLSVGTYNKQQPHKYDPFKVT